MNILNECSFIKPEAISKIEEHYNAKYVFESCLKGKDGEWLNFPCAIFYTENAHPEGSNYFAVFFQANDDTGMDLMIADGITAVEDFTGLNVDGDVIYSRYRHDYRSHKNMAIDGGRDYTRIIGDLNPSNRVTVRVVKDHLEVVNDESGIPA